VIRHFILDEKPVDNGPIEPKTINDVPADPYPLPDAFAWCNVDMNDDKQVLPDKQSHSMLCPWWIGFLFNRYGYAESRRSTRCTHCWWRTTWRTKQDIIDSIIRANFCAGT